MCLCIPVCVCMCNEDITETPASSVSMVATFSPGSVVKIDWSPKEHGSDQYIYSLQRTDIVVTTEW